MRARSYLHTKMRALSACEESERSMRLCNIYTLRNTSSVHARSGLFFRAL